MKYYEIAHAVNIRNIIVTSNEAQKYHKLAIENKREFYRSYYYFDEKILEHMKIRKTTAGFIGKFGIDKILFDIDLREVTDDKRLFVARNLVSELIDEWLLPKESIAIWYSGRGYHITTPNFFGFESSEKLPLIMLTTINKYFPYVGMEIYNSNRIVRTANTWNKKGKSFKVYLTYEELFQLNYPEIKKISETNRILLPESIDDSEITIFTDKILYPIEQKGNSKKEDFSNYVTCMQKLYAEGPKEGSRHHAVMRMVSSWKRRGIPYDVILVGMKKWAIGMSDYEIEKMVKDTFNANNGEGYNFGCHDYMFQKYCDKKCVFYAHKNLTPEIVTNTQAEKGFVDFIRSDYKDRSIDLMKVLGVKDQSYLLIPGDVMLFFGNGGLGKTALAQNIAVRTKNMKVLYCNFEMEMNLLYRRFVQINNMMSKEDVINHYMSNDNSLSHGIDHIHTVDNPIGFFELKQLCETINPGLIIIDTVLKMRTNDRNEYAKSVTIANAVKEEIAKKYKTIVINVHHIPKSQAVSFHGKPTKLTQHSGKGANDLENMSDHVMMLEGLETNDFRSISMGKGRDESKFIKQFQYHWNTFTYQYLEV